MNLNFSPSMTRTKISVVIKVVALLFYFLLAVILAKAQIGSDFSVDTDGWNTYNANTVTSTPATYNAAGYITDGGVSNFQILYAEAPSKFRGNRSFSYNQDLSFQLKTDNVGTDNTNGDVIITGTGGTLYFQLSSKPGALFTAYTVTHRETFAGWHLNSIAGAAPTQTQMKAVLSNITSLRIRTKYITSNTFTVTGSLDNVVLSLPALAPPPVITSFTPTTALPG